MQRILFSLLFFLSSTLSAESLHLKDQLAKAREGDFVVTLQNRAYSLLHVLERRGAILVLEELTVPQNRREADKKSWQEWIMADAPHVSSWVLYEIDTRTGSILEAFSVTSRAWLEIEPQENFLSSLLAINLEKVPDKDRKRMGAPPTSGREDLRRIWHPRLVVDGKPIKGVPFDAWNAEWPKDGSELSGKKVTAYLPAKEGAYPSYFPYWLELTAGIGRAHVRIVDSGAELYSPSQGIPHRPPVFLDSGKRSETGLRFRVQGRPYFAEYRLLALNADRSSEPPLTIPYEVIEGDLKSTFIIEVQQDALTAELDPAHRYTFLLSPVGSEHLYAKTREPIPASTLGQ